MLRVSEQPVGVQRGGGTFKRLGIVLQKLGRQEHVFVRVLFPRHHEVN
jgi:hypothetical protein